MLLKYKLYDKIKEKAEKRFKMFRYETHLHTYPVSKCASAEVVDVMKLYKELEYDGVFITNHFIDGNINIENTASYEEKINFYFSDYEKGKAAEEEIGIKVFCGVESTYGGTDFLIYGLDKEWFLANPQIMDMKKSQQLQFFMDNGALVIQAHPFREAAYIDHIRLFPRNVHGVEIINAGRKEAENKMAEIYAEYYDLIKFAGSDKHSAKKKGNLAGMCSETPVLSVQDFIDKVKNREMNVFEMKLL